jgi:hemolysin activation/secretion protein
LGAAVLLATNLVHVPSACAQPTSVEPGTIQKELAPKPAPKTRGGISIPAPMMQAAPKGAAETHLTLNRLDIVGATVFTQSKIESFGAALIGKDVSLAGIFAVAEVITKAYSDAGYPLSLAYVPAQQIKDGRVRIQVVEGYVDEVEIAGDAGKSNAMLVAYGEKIKAVRPLTKVALERYLLLANDLPGLSVRGFIDRGPTGLGAVKLILSASRKATGASMGYNNRGSRALGPHRTILNLAEFGNATGLESARFALVQSLQSGELTYLYGRADTLINNEGTVLGLTGTFSHSKPGTPALKALNFKTRGWTTTADLSHPIIRSRSLNFDLTGSFDVRDLRSDFGAIAQSHDKLRVARLDASTYFFDAAGGVTHTDVLFSQGLNVLGATRASDPLKSRPDGSAEFTSVSAELVHTHALARGFDATLSLNAQMASRALLASEECGYGGGAYGRGFDNYEISGENCLTGSIEISHALALKSRVLSLTPYGFYDAGLVRQRGPLLPGDKRQESGASVGGGVRFGLARYLKGSVEYAKPLSRDVALEGNRKARIFISITLAP